MAVVVWAPQAAFFSCSPRLTHVSTYVCLRRARAATQAAFPGWSGRTPKARAAVLLKLHALLETHATALADLIVLENGKNSVEARADVAKGNETVQGRGCHMFEVLGCRWLIVGALCAAGSDLVHCTATCISLIDPLLCWHPLAPASFSFQVEYACSLPQLLQGQKLEVSRGVHCEDVKEPVGVVAAIVPFNFPLMVTHTTAHVLDTPL